MTYKGKGIVWNPKDNKIVVNFRETPEYSPKNAYEEELLKTALHCEPVGSMAIEDGPEDPEIELVSSGMTKKEVMESLDASGIEYNPRDKKEVLLKLLEG